MSRPPSPSLRALMEGVIDYAGLFPPASLSLEESIRNYARYLGEPEAWMLGRFICPAARLHELVAHLPELFASPGARGAPPGRHPYDNEAAPRSAPLVISALGRGGKSAAEFEQGLAADLDAIATFRNTVKGLAVIDVFETRAPDPAAEAAGPCARALEKRCRPAALRPFLEIGFAGDWRAHLPRIAQTLAEHRVGCKIRSGGVEAAAFPSTDQLAAAIVACRDAGCTMKFTAGLHHPLRHFNEGVKTKMHGFLNVFFAAALARACDFDEQHVRRVLEEQDPCCFRFRDYGLSFGEHAVSNEQVLDLRREFATSFGSCSFDEPRDDLRKLELL